MDIRKVWNISLIFHIKLEDDEYSVLLFVGKEDLEDNEKDFQLLTSGKSGDVYISFNADNDYAPYNFELSVDLGYQPYQVTLMVAIPLLVVLGFAIIVLFIISKKYNSLPKEKHTPNELVVRMWFPGNIIVIPFLVAGIVFIIIGFVSIFRRKETCIEIVLEIQ
jgi:hypothetical protein